MKKQNLTNRVTAKTGAKALISLILILFSVTFQLSPLVWAAQRLPVLDLGEPQDAEMLAILNAVRGAGYQPWAIREDDFVFNIRPQSDRTVLIPFGRRISDEALTIINRYVENGGRVVLFPSGSDPALSALSPDPSLDRLYKTIGLSAPGRILTAQPLDFHWKNNEAATAESLPAGSGLQLIESGPDRQILATWGEEYPAIILTQKGALLNWQWGRQLSEQSNALSLGRVLPLLTAEALPPEPAEIPKPQETVGETPARRIFTSNPTVEPKHLGKAQEQPLTQTEPSEKVAEPATAPVQPAVMKATVQQNPPASPVPSPADQSTSPPAISAPSDTVPTLPSNPATPVAPLPAEPVTGVPSSAGNVSASHPPINPAPSSAAASAPAVRNSTSAGAEASPASADAEVLNNILGGEVVKPVASEGEKPNGAQAEVGQKHFSFLDPEARELLAPSFDYGLYSMYMRVLDDYKKRIMDALETSSQLSLNLPKDQVLALVKESDSHKRQFESLYLGNKTEEGLARFAQAKRSMLQALALTTQSPKVEGRAIWLDRATILGAANPAGLKKILQKLHGAGINIVYFETLNAGFPIYPSKILKAAVEEGHRLGMEVHAWVWCFAVGNKRHNPLLGLPETYPGPVLAEGGMMSEALRNREGGLEVDGRQKEYWLSPASPKGRELLLNVYREIVDNYAVDGLHLDYIRYPFQTAGTRMGYEAVGQERFRQSTGVDPAQADDGAARVWIAWKTYQVSSFVQQVSETVKKVRPELKLSAAVFPMRREARIVAIQQDWETWIDNGWIDTLSPMSYTTDPERLQELFSYVNTSSQKHTLVYPGIAINRLDGGQLVLQLEALREKGSLGSTLFAGAYLDGEKQDTLAAGPFRDRESLPPHRDVVRSLQTVLTDYEEKFGKLANETAVQGLTPVQAKAIQDAVARFGITLNSIGPDHSPVHIPHEKLREVIRQFQNLQTASTLWTAADRTQHPYRAQYFDNLTVLLSELLGYLADKNGLPNTTALRNTAPVASKHRPAIMTVIETSTLEKKQSDSAPENESNAGMEAAPDPVGIPN